MQTVTLKHAEPVRITYTKQDGTTETREYWFDEGNGRIDLFIPVPAPDKAE